MNRPDESPATLLARALGLIAEGRWRDARPLLERLAEDPACDAAIVRQLAESEILTGDAARAMKRLERLEADDEADFLRARAEEALGMTAAARDRLLALRDRLAVPSAMVALRLGIVHQRLGEIDAAIAATAEAVRLQPRMAAAHENLAALWLELAVAQTEAGDAAAATGSLANAVAAGPQQAATWTSIGALYAEHFEYQDADRALANASALDPGAAEVETVRAGVKQELGDNAGAMHALALAASRDPGDMRVAFAQRLFLPQIYDGVEDVAAWRRRFSEGLASLERDEPRWSARAEEVFRLARSNFFLAYQGEDDRGLQERYMRLIARLAGAAAPELRAPMAGAPREGRRIRVGFFGNVFRESTAGRYFERWVTGLDAARFERFVYHTAPVTDALTRRVAAAADHFIDRRLDTRATARMLRAEDLDILVYPEVGMSTLICVLAALRLAPVQCAGWGHPVTTGSDAIDYYFTCGAMEPPGSEAHYTERLIALPGIGVDYAMPATAPRVLRAELGLPDGAHIYICPQSLFKIHPEMDGVFADILAADPLALLVLFQAPARAVTEQLAARIQRALATRGIAPRGQVKFLPRLPGPQFRAALSIADVVLDTVRWSGGNTSLDAFAAGAPVVAIPGRFMRGRQTSAMLGMLGLDDLVASDPSGYVRIALDLARDRERNSAVRKAIAERRESLFDRREPVAALGEALVQIAPR